MGRNPLTNPARSVVRPRATRSLPISKRVCRIVPIIMAGSTGSEAGSPLRLSAEPIICPIGRPPPAKASVPRRAQWSRPPFLLTVGVRPKSPVTTSRTSSDSQRFERSVRKASRALSRVVPSMFMPLTIGGLLLSACMSQPALCTVTNPAPASTRRRAINI